MTRPRKAKSTASANSDFSIHDPNKPELSRQEQARRFAKLKKLLSALKSATE